MKDKVVSEEDKNCIKRISENLASQELKYGHFELHNDNIMFDGEKIFFIDFEKFHPHVPQLDLISLMMNENINKENIKKYIDYYIRINNISNKEEFLYTLDCANIFYNLKIVNMIIRNLLGCETRWVEENGQRVKKIERTNSNFGSNWNKERNESIEMRIKNILEFNFSSNAEIEKLKNNLFGDILQEIRIKLNEEGNKKNVEI